MEHTAKGKIIKGVGGLYTVKLTEKSPLLPPELNQVECRAKGAFRHSKITPLVGDTVELLKLGTKASVIEIKKDGSLQLQAGILKMTAKPDEVYLLEASGCAENQLVRLLGGHYALQGFIIGSEFFAFDEGLSVLYKGG